MAQTDRESSVSQCKTCGYEAAEDDAWERVESPTLGQMTSCPDCGSTDITLRR
jgi:predicted Zn-ribbon and HTH transcriptional regulator